MPHRPLNRLGDGPPRLASLRAPTGPPLARPPISPTAVTNSPPNIPVGLRNFGNRPSASQGPEIAGMGLEERLRRQRLAGL